MNTPIISGTPDNGSLANTVNSLIRDVQQHETTQIFKDDSGMRRVLFGKGKDGFYGMKVSKAGYDVFESEDTNLIFNSSRSGFIIVAEGEATITEATTSGSAVGHYANLSQIFIPHGLGYTPAYDAYVVYGETRLKLPFWQTVSGSAKHVTRNNLYIYVDDTNVVLNVETSMSIFVAGAVTEEDLEYPFKWFLMQEVLDGS